MSKQTLLDIAPKSELHLCIWLRDAHKSNKSINNILTPEHLSIGQISQRAQEPRQPHCQHESVEQFDQDGNLNVNYVCQMDDSYIERLINLVEMKECNNIQRISKLCDLKAGDKQPFPCIHNIARAQRPRHGSDSWRRFLCAQYTYMIRIEDDPGCCLGVFSRDSAVEPRKHVIAMRHGEGVRKSIHIPISSHQLDYSLQLALLEEQNRQRLILSQKKETERRQTLESRKYFEYPNPVDFPELETVTEIRSETERVLCVAPTTVKGQSHTRDEMDIVDSTADEDDDLDGASGDDTSDDFDPSHEPECVCSKWAGLLQPVCGGHCDHLQPSCSFIRDFDRLRCALFEQHSGNDLEHVFHRISCLVTDGLFDYNGRVTLHSPVTYDGSSKHLLETTISAFEAMQTYGEALLVLEKLSDCREAGSNQDSQETALAKLGVIKRALAGAERFRYQYMETMHDQIMKG